MKFRKTLATDEDGAVLVDETNRPGYRDGVRGVAQELRTMLKTVRGEDPIDEDHGLDVFEIAGSPPPVLRREVRKALLRDDRVASLGDVSVDRDEERPRHFEVSVEVELVNGVEIELEAEVS